MGGSHRGGGGSRVSTPTSSYEYICFIACCKDYIGGEHLKRVRDRG